MKIDRLLSAAALIALLTFAGAVAPAHADTIQYTLTDGTNVITFSLPQHPTPVAYTADWFAESTTVTVDGVSSTEDVTFYDLAYLGGLSIASTPYTDQILDQQGAQLYSGSTKFPELLAEKNVSLSCTAIKSPTPCSADTYHNSFILNAVDVPTPEPTSLALTLAGLGLLGVMLVKSRH
jgi:hypothetical protein